jgi:hypothetical protein
MKHTRWSWWLVLLLASGCASAPSAPSVHWLREDVHPKTVQGDRRLDRAKIWSGDSVVQWRAVVVTRDSISGIPYNLPEPCDSCRRALAVSAVDSLDVGYPKNVGSSNNGHGDFDPVWLPLLIIVALLTP